MTAMQSVADALEGVANWRSEQEAQRQAEIVDVESQLEKLTAQLTELQGKIESLREFRAKIDERETDEGVVARSYDAIFAALLGQSAGLNDRALELAAAEEARNAQVLATLSKTDLAPLIQEYNQFKEQVEPTLAALPESYRGAIIGHHQGVVGRIRAQLAEALSEPIKLEAERIEFELVFGIDAPNGAPELLVMVLPVPEAAYTDWSDRPEDLCTYVGARVVQAVYEASKQTGPVGAQAACGGHQGLLAIELDLEGAKPDFAQSLLDSLKVVLMSAPELAAAGIGLTARQVDFDLLLPPELDEEES